MKNLILLIFLLVFFSFSCTHPAQKNKDDNDLETQKENVQSLFNGKNFDNWRSISSDSAPEYGWKIENNELIIEESGGGESQHGGDIITRKEFSDFDLQWEWKMLTKGGNSGVKYFVKSSGEGNKKYGLGLEYQILDDENHPWMLEGKMSPNDFHTAGAVYEIYPPNEKKKLSPLGKWNKSRIVSENGKVEHWLNGEKIVEYNRFSDDFDQRVAESKFNKYQHFGKHDSGHILIQDHGSHVHFKNITIKELH